jgi:hypothetical protein
VKQPERLGEPITDQAVGSAGYFRLLPQADSAWPRQHSHGLDSLEGSVDFVTKPVATREPGFIQPNLHLRPLETMIPPTVLPPANHENPQVN